MYLLSIIDQAGWVCLHCCSSLNKLHKKMIRTTEEIADTRVSMAWLFEEVNNFLKRDHTQPATGTSESIDPFSTASDSCQTVHPQNKWDLKTETNNLLIPEGSPGGTRKTMENNICKRDWFYV